MFKKLSRIAPDKPRAQSLGNTLSVCQEHYAGFALTTDSFEAITVIVARALE